LLESGNNELLPGGQFLCFFLLVAKKTGLVDKKVLSVFMKAIEEKKTFCAFRVTFLCL